MEQIRTRLEAVIVDGVNIIEEIIKNRKSFYNEYEKEIYYNAIRYVNVRTGESYNWKVKIDDIAFIIWSILECEYAIDNLTKDEELIVIKEKKGVYNVWEKSIYEEENSSKQTPKNVTILKFGSKIRVIQ